MKANNDKARLLGLAAAQVAIDDMIKESRAACEPYGKRQGHTLKWWQGHFQGLVSAHAMLAIADYPEAHENPKQIKELLTRTHP